MRKKKNIFVTALLGILLAFFNTVSAQNSQGAMVFTNMDLNLISGNTYDMLNLIPQVEVSHDGIISISGNGEALVLINNKPAASGGDYRPILEQLQIEVISEIEIISGPSARYDPEANGGVVNINISGNGLEGFSGSLQMKAQTGEKGGVNGGIMLKKQKWGIQLNANANQYKTKTTNQLYQSNYNIEDTIHINQTIINQPTVKRLSSDFAIDYNLNDFHAIEFTGALGGRSIMVETDIESVSNDESHTYAYINTREDDGINNRMTLNYDGLLSGESELRRNLNITTGYFYSKTGNFKNTQLIYNDFIDTDLLHINLQTDYQQELLNSSNFEAGLRSYMRETGMDFKRDSLGIYQETAPVAQDDFNFKENIHAGYMQWSGNYESFYLSGGLRSEISYINAYQNLISTQFNQNYMHFFPTAFIGYNFSDRHQFNFNYNRTIRRPRMHEMNPFINDINPNNIQFGNPDLKPALTHNFEIKYNGNYENDQNSKSFKKHNWSAGFGYRNRQDQIYRATLSSDKSEGVVETSFYNLKNRQDYTVNLIYNTQLFKWFSIDVLPSYRFIFQDGTNIDDEIINSSGYYQLRLNSHINLWQDAQIIINSFFRSAYDSPQGKQKAFGRTNISFSQLLLDDKLTLTFAARDPFSQSKIHSNVRQNDFSIDRVFEFESSIYEIGIRFNFGKIRIQEDNRKKINLID